MIARRLPGAAFVLLGFASLLDAAPMLRLVNSAVVPVPLPVGANGIFGTTAATPSYAGLSPGSVGLYQVNVAIPAGVSSGTVEVKLVFPDGVGNIVQLAVQ